VTYASLSFVWQQHLPTPQTNPIKTTSAPAAMATMIPVDNNQGEVVESENALPPLMVVLLSTMGVSAALLVPPFRAAVVVVGAVPAFGLKVVVMAAVATVLVVVGCTAVGLIG